MERVIRVGKIEAIKGLCSVGFFVRCELDIMTSMDVTHGRMYELLDSATEVKQEGQGVSFKQGVLKFTAYKK